MKGKRKGFTLVELLIVIALIGIMASAMMISGFEAVSTGNANKIINNMLQLKTATYAWYKDNISRIVPDGSGYKIRTKGTDQNFSSFVASHKSEILAYLDNSESITLLGKNETPNEQGDYTLIAVDNARKWYVCCNLGGGGYGAGDSDNSVRKKLAGRAKSLGLLGKANVADETFEGESYTDADFVCMLILTIGG